MGAMVKLQAFTARSFFLLHNLMTVCYTNMVLEPTEYRILFLLTACILLEGVFTVFRRGGVESKWFSQSTLVFLTATVPCIWLLELDRLDAYNQQQALNVSVEDNNNSAATLNTWRAAEAIEIPGVDVTLTLPRQTWLELTKQSFLGVVIFGRWLLPLCTITRNQLSLLLFVYFAMASDIMELFQLFEDPRITRTPLLPYCILGVWSLSLLQFVIVLTMTRNFRRARPIQEFSFRSRKGSSRRGRSYALSGPATDSGSKDESTPNCCVLGCLSSDVWSILVTLLLMDGPFLGVRLYVVVGLEVIGYNIIFFVIKNVLIVCLSLYRLAIIFMLAYGYTQKNKNKSHSKAAV